MRSKQKIITIEFTVIALLWTLVIVSPLLFMSDSNQNWRSIHVMWVETAVVGVIFLINRFVLMPRLFFTRKYSIYIASLTLLLVALAIFIFYYDGINKILYLFTDGYSDQVMAHRGRFMPSRRLPHNVPLIPPKYGVLILAAIVIALDMGLSIAMRWIVSEQKQIEIEKEKAQAQLSNLQSQVSPHFFMNTLNNIHALVDIDSVRAKQTIIELSSLMDYLLYDAVSKKGVALQKELDFINSYINLMRIRFSDGVRVDVCYSQSVPPIKIPPFLFLNFIENAFNYGIDSELESFVSVEFEFGKDTIIMKVVNSNHSQNTKRGRGGIGISNSRKRLGLLYGNRYSLDITDNQKQYSVTLKIPILYD